jgi:hypothetical protein
MMELVALAVILPAVFSLIGIAVLTYAVAKDLRRGA